VSEPDLDPPAEGTLKLRMLEVARLAARLAISLLIAAVVVAPLAVEHGIEHAQVHDAVGVAPATLTLSGNSTSELRLGLLGSFVAPFSKGRLGISATIDRPPSTSPGGDVAAYFSPQMLEIYSALFHDPSRALDGYADSMARDLRHQILVDELLYTAIGGSALFLISWLLLPSIGAIPRTHGLRLTAAAIAVALVATGATAFVHFKQWEDRTAITQPTYPLPSLDGTRAEGIVTDSPLLRLAIEQAIPKVNTLIARQEHQTNTFIDTASAGLDAEADLMQGPRSDERAIMMQSDMHCSTSMIRLQKQTVQMLDERFGEGTVSALAITGDLTTNGTAAEESCIRDEADISDGAPVVAVTGNHESEISADQMRDAGMTVLDGKAEQVADTTFLGANDPARTEMFGGTFLRGDETEESVGQDLFTTATDAHPGMVLMHEAYAAQAFVGGDTTDMRAFMDQPESRNQYVDDGVRDLPASAVFYGHWHRDVAPRVVWNSDGSWTLVMELNTSGGAIATPTLNHFSTPWSPPQQVASFPLIFTSRDTGLVTGYQLYTFGTDGRVTVSPRVDIGAPDGRPIADIPPSGSSE
jgi:hypothetical protein